MSILTQARASDARALVGAVALGSLVGLAIGGAYLAGGLARSAVTQERFSRLAAASDGLSEAGLTQTSAGDPAALAVARRHDPAVAEQAPEAVVARRAFAGAEQARIRATRVNLPTSEAARPFQLRGAVGESRDLECLTQAVYYESRGEGSAGQAAVAQVILNRVRHPSFPKSICAVVFQGCQFSFSCDGSAKRKVEAAAWRRAERVAAKALDGFVMEQVGTATHFHVANLSPVWSARLMKVGQIGAHIFYRFGGRKGSGSAFKGEAEPSVEALPPAAPAPQTNQPILASLALTMPTVAAEPPIQASAPVDAKAVVTPAVAPAAPAPAAKPVAADEPIKTATAVPQV